MIKKEDFINYAVDCQGYSNDEAIELANEYQGNYVEYFEERGVLDDALAFFK